MQIDLMGSISIISVALKANWQLVGSGCFYMNSTADDFLSLATFLSNVIRACCGSSLNELRCNNKHNVPMHELYYSCLALYTRFVSLIAAKLQIFFLWGLVTIYKSLPQHLKVIFTKNDWANLLRSCQFWYWVCYYCCRMASQTLFSFLLPRQVATQCLALWMQNIEVTISIFIFVHIVRKYGLGIFVH